MPDKLIKANAIKTQLQCNHKLAEARGSVRRRRVVITTWRTCRLIHNGDATAFRCQSQADGGGAAGNQQNYIDSIVQLLISLTCIARQVKAETKLRIRSVAQFDPKAHVSACECVGVRIYY